MLNKNKQYLYTTLNKQQQKEERRRRMKR